MNNINKEEFRVLDPVKISMMGLNKFIKDYGIVAKMDFKARLRHLKQLSESDKVDEKDKGDMVGILATLDKITFCEVCHKEIDWDKSGALYAILPNVSARHQACHKELKKN